jgi:hypothetical protein
MNWFCIDASSTTICNSKAEHAKNVRKEGNAAHLSTNSNILASSGLKICKHGMM